MTLAITMLRVGFFVLGTALTTFTQSFAASFTPNPAGLGVAKFFVADDARLGIFSAGNAVFHYEKWIGPYIKTTPGHIEQDYRNNEISADEKYKGMLIVFSGRINSISKDLFDNLYVTVDTGQMFRDIHADMDEDIAALSKLSRGGNIDLVCKGASYSMASPVLSHCRLRNGYMSSQEQQAADDVAGWLNGGEAPPFLDPPEMRTIAFYLYFCGTKIPNPEQCTRQLGGNVTACGKQLKAARPSNGEFRAAMDATRNQLGLAANLPVFRGK